MNPTNAVIGKISRNPRESVIITLIAYRSEALIDVRTFSIDREDATRSKRDVPTKAGLRMSLRETERLIAFLEQALKLGRVLEVPVDGRGRKDRFGGGVAPRRDNVA